MADLRRRADGRGQLLLLGAFALAALFVTLALILNVVIYTENLATRADSRTSDVVAHSQSVERATVDLLQYVNENSTSDSTYSDLKDEFGVGFSNFTTGTARFQLTSGVVTTGTNRTEFEGTWLTQTNENRNFTNRSGDPVDWKPVDDGSGTGVRSFRIQVQDLSGSFEVEASDGTDSWELDIGPSISSNVTVTDADGSHECPSPSTLPFWINLSEGTVEGTSCDLPAFAEDLGPIQTIEFEHPEQINGTYQLMVNETETSFTSNFGSNEDGPFTKPALYGAVVGIEYETTKLSYRTDRRVVPGETDG